MAPKKETSTTELLKILRKNNADESSTTAGIPDKKAIEKEFGIENKASATESLPNEEAIKKQFGIEDEPSSTVSLPNKKAIEREFGIEDELSTVANRPEEGIKKQSRVHNKVSATASTSRGKTVKKQSGVNDKASTAANLPKGKKIKELFRFSKDKGPTRRMVLPKEKFIKKQITVGIDISSSSVRLTAVSHKKEYRLLGYLQANLSSQSPHLMGNELASLLKKFCAPFPSCEFWFQMSSINVESLHYEIPQVESKQLDSTAFWVAQKEKKIDTFTHLFDYHILGQKEENGVKKYRVLAYSVPKKEVEDWKHFFQDIGYPLQGITITPFCIQNMFQTKWLNAPEEASSAHIFIGSDWSRIDIFHKNTLVFNRDVKTGINSVLAEIQDVYHPSGKKQTSQASPKSPEKENLEEEKNLELEEVPADHVPEPQTSYPKISTDQANDILMSQLLDGKQLAPRQPGAELTSDQIFDFIRPAITRLLRQIQRTVSHYNNTMNLSPVEKIFISGSMSLYPPLLKYIEEELGLKIEACDPFQDGRHQSEKLLLPPKRGQRSLFMPAIGLALSANPRTPNFLFTYREKNNERKLTRIKRGVLAAGFLALFLAFGINIAAMLHLHGKQSALADLNKKHSTLKLNQTSIEEQIKATDPSIDLSNIREVNEKIQALNRFLEVSAARYAPVAFLSEFFSLTPEGIAIHKIFYSSPTTPFTLTYNTYKQTTKTEKPTQFSSPFGFFDLKQETKKITNKFPNSEFVLVDGVVTTNAQDKNLTLSVYKMLLDNSPFFKVLDVEKNSQIAPGIGNALHFTLALKVAL